MLLPADRFGFDQSGIPLLVAGSLGAGGPARVTAALACWSLACRSVSFSRTSTSPARTC